MLHLINIIENIQQFHLYNCKLCGKEYPKLPQLDELLYHIVYGNRSSTIPTKSLKLNNVHNTTKITHKNKDLSFNQSHVPIYTKISVDDCINNKQVWKPNYVVVVFVKPYFLFSKYMHQCK